MPAYPKPVQQLIHHLKTPAQVQRWLYSLTYNKSETMRTLRGVVKTKKAHCLEAVLATATILEHHDYPPLVLDLESADLLGHDLFLYQHKGRYGTVGWSRDTGLNGRKPVYKTIHQLVQSYAAPYIDQKARITGYAVYDLRKLKKDDWRSTTGNVWYVEKKLRELPHTKIPQSKVFVSRWRKKYIAFKKLHPDEQPTIYGPQPTWM